MITIDVSDSMKKTDLQPSRIAAAVDAAERFADEAPTDTSIGLTTFADRTAVVLAPTTDRDALHRALEGLGDLRVGTALGEGVNTSLSALEAAGAVADPPPANPSDSPGRILLLTDGANSIPNATSPEAAAQRAAAAGVPIYTILLGNDPGRPDQPLPSETLSAMSTSTGGIFAQTTTDGRPLRRVRRHRIRRRPGRSAARADGLVRGARHRPPRGRGAPGRALPAAPAAAPGGPVAGPSA